LTASRRGAGTIDFAKASPYVHNVTIVESACGAVIGATPAFPEARDRDVHLTARS
jgi:hypothetical protein